MSFLSWRPGALSGGEAWLAAGAAAALVFFAVRLFRRSLPLSSKILLAAARLSAAVLAFLVLWGPEVSRRRRLKDVPVAFVLDASASMAAADAGGKASRAGAAAEALDRLRPALAGKVSPSFFRLGERLERSEDWRAAPAARLSDFSRLAGLSGAVPGLKAVVFFSDGRRGGGPDPAPLLASRGVPVYAVGTGDPAARPDLAVERVRVPPFAFKDAEVRAEVRLLLRGLPPGKSILRVVSRGETVGKTEVSWTSQEVLEATVSFRPARAGLEGFELRAAAVPGEESLKNNARRFAVDVARDRRRVLYICGRPGPNYAYLRHQLKSDPTVELVTFVILRDMEDVLAVPDRELSLIPFPTQVQLLEGLSGFDAVIFEDFSFRRFGVGDAGMAALRRFVEGGGGFLLIGDGDAFGPEGNPYRGSAMEHLLPFHPDALGVPGPRRFRAEPLPSPLTSIGEGPGPWTLLPPLEGTGFFPGSLRRGAVPLFAASAGGRSVPWAALFSAGRGRTMAVASLTTWRWALGEAGQGRGPETYVRFWNGALDWLTGGAEYRRVRLEVPEEGAAPGEEAVVRAHVRDEAGKPVSDADVRLEGRGPDGARLSGRMAPAGDGSYVFSLAAPADVLLKARAFRGGRPVGEAEALLKAGTDWDEGRDLSPDFAGLEALCRATGGGFTPLSGFTEEWLSRALDEASRETGRPVPLGASPWTGVLLAAILLAEWVFRRKRGLP